jgi:hypothetical protein
MNLLAKDPAFYPAAPDRDKPFSSTYFPFLILVEVLLFWLGFMGIKRMRTFANPDPLHNF